MFALWGRLPVRTATAAVPAFLDLRLGLKPSKILSHCTLLTLRVGPVQLVRRLCRDSGWHWLPSRSHPPFPMAIHSMELRNPPHSLAFSIALKESFNGDGAVVSYLNNVRTTKETRSR
jgi:hypothetical protein